jgi:hypothetical protein
MSCPSCNAEFSLDMLFEHEAGRRAMARLAELSLPFGALLLRYIGLFRPAQRRLSIDRMVSLIDELLPDIERQAIARKGRDWDAPLESWRAALEAVLTKRDKGTLTLPLTSHGLLYEILAAQADKYEAQAERQVETERRHHRPAGPVQTTPAPMAKPAAAALAALAQARQRVAEGGLARTDDPATNGSADA